MKKKRAGRPLQWHPAFYAGVRIELEQDAENLVFENEHQLGTKPKQIDILIIKKDTDVPVRKNIGRIFRKHNVIEYKSPDDSLLIDDFYRVYGYACFYKADTGRNDSLPVGELTITFACGRYPRKLVKHWKENRHYKIRREEPGIYRIEGDIIPMQLLILSKLSPEENLWLSSLGRKVSDAATVDRLVAEYGKHRDETLYQSMMDIIVKANARKFQEVNERMLCDALMELFDAQYKDKLEAEVEAKVEAKVEAEVEAAETRITADVTKRCQAEGLKTITDILKGLSLDFDVAYQAIIKTETYAKVPKEKMMEHWKQMEEKTSR